MKKMLWGLLLFFLPLLVYADTVDYKINHYYIDAAILENGDMEITELIVLKGSFNGYIRDITYRNSTLGSEGYESNAIYNATDIEIEEIAAKKVDDVTFATIKDTDFKPLLFGRAANFGYIESPINNGYSYKMYFKSQNEQVAFRLKYLVKDVAVLHNDVGEVYYTFIGNDYDDAIYDLQIKVNLPKKDESNSFKVWAHGDLSGTIFPYENSYLLATIPSLEPYSPIDIRTTFSPSVLNESLVEKQTTENALEGILKVEEARANKANQERKRIKFIYYGMLAFSIIYLILFILAWIWVYIKYDKEYRAEFKNKYNREFIDDYNVEVVDYLMNKKITPNALSASIMNLVYKKNIKVEEIPNEKKQKEYQFTLVNEENLSETEKYLTDFLFTKVGKENVFTSKELQEYAKSTKTCDKFSASYTTWRQKVIRDGKDNNFFESNAKAKSVGLMFFIFALFIYILKSILNVEMFLCTFNFGLSILFLIYTFSFFKRTKKGNEDYAKWNAFKNFLNDFGTFEMKELPEIVLWERYMVYATVFGIADKVAKVMNVKIKEIETSDIMDYYPTFTDYYFYNSIDHLVHHALETNHSAIVAKNAASSYSSGSGGGGGFSSGGGFGGGGGGGHGF